MYLTAPMIVRISAAASLCSKLGRARSRGAKEDALLVIVALGAYTVEELAARAEVEAKAEIVCRLRDRDLDLAVIGIDAVWERTSK